MEELLARPAVAAIEALLPAYLTQRRWFRGKARRVTGAEVVEVIPVAVERGSAALVLIQVDFTDGDPDVYAVPLALARGEEAERIVARSRHVVLARVASNGSSNEPRLVRDGAGDGVVFDAMADRSFARAILDAIVARRRFKGRAGSLHGMSSRAHRSLLGSAADRLEPSLSQAEQSNSSILFGDRLMFKLYRRLEPGINPEVELGTFLTERGFEHVPAIAGTLEYRGQHGEARAVASLQAFVPNEGDAWDFTIDAITDYLERAATSIVPPEPVGSRVGVLLDLAEREPPPLARSMIETYLDTAWLLGVRTGDMHKLLASNVDDPAFTPEPFTPFNQRSLYQSVRNQSRQAYLLLGRRLSSLPEELRPAARTLLEGEPALQKRLRRLADTKLSGTRIRCHGDYHLGQVLYTGRDLVIIDFEGEPARSITERRLKRSPLSDVAGMIRSFHYAAYGSLIDPNLGPTIRPEDLPALEPWVRFWYSWTAATFLGGYLETVAGADFMPASRAELEILLDSFLIEKGTYELAYELNNRPDWVPIPIQGILELSES
jgi:maltose alpha-D-glucosyltransferase/alpha-amylase